MHTNASLSPTSLPPDLQTGVDANEKNEYNPVWPDRLSKGL